MLTEIERSVNWVRRRNPNPCTWRDCLTDLRQFVASRRTSAVFLISRGP